MIYERLKALCELNKISINKLEILVGVSRGSICKIDKHKPSFEKLQKIAEVLNTTTEYILNGEEKEKEKSFPTYDPRIYEVITLFDKMTEKQKNHIIELSKEFATCNTKLEELQQYYDAIKEMQK